MKHLNSFLLVGALLAVLTSQALQLASAADAGSVMAWGCKNIPEGQCTVPAGLSGVISISGNSGQSLALKSDGTVVTWGCQNGQDAGQCSIPAGLSGITAIAAGQYHNIGMGIGLPTPTNTRTECAGVGS